MADIKDIFGESDSEEEEAGEDADVGKLFELSDDEEDAAPIARKRLTQRKPEAPKAKAGAPAPAGDAGDAGNAYDSDDEPEETDADRAFIDTEGDDEALLAEYRAEKQDFREDRPVEGDDFEAAEPAAAARNKPDDSNPMAPTLTRMKRKRTKEMDTDAKDKVVQSALQRMSDAMTEDEAALKDGEPALSKIKLLPTIARVFKQRALRQTLLDFDALDLVTKWLAPNPDGTPPSLAVRRGLLEACQEFPALPEHLKRSGLGRVVMKIARDKTETPANRRLAKALVEAWSRPVVGKSLDYKQLQEATELRFKRSVRGNIAAVDEKKDDADEIFARENDAMAPSHRVRVPHFNGFDFVVRPESSVAAPAAGRKKAPAADSSKGRLAKKIKRR
jgi:transcription factor SPN1